MNESDFSMSPRVVIFGAGIAGLSAAQELVERGFDVHVVDPSGKDQGDVAVGGIARTQWAHSVSPLRFSAAARENEERQARQVFRIWLSQPMRPTLECAQRRFVFSDDQLGKLKSLGESDEEDLLGRLGDFISEMTAFHEKWREDSKARILAWSNRLEPTQRWLKCKRGTYVFIRPEGSPLKLTEKQCDLMLKWFNELFRTRARLIYAPPIQAETIAKIEDMLRWLELPVESVELNDADPVTGSTVSSTLALVIEPDAGVVPGEHGYRYFPSFYRNLFDSMQRIRLYKGGRQTRFTTLDNLVGAPDLHLALPDDRPPLSLPRRRIRSFEELRRMLSSRWGRLGAMPSDVRHLERRMLRYLTSSSARRELQYQDITWWEFLDGHRLRPDMHRLLRHTPQALIAMDIDEVDARTHGNILVQLLLDHLRPGAEVDRVLNGPTTLALLDPWKEYLLRLGVTFHSGYVESLQWHAESKRVRPKVKYQGYSEDIGEDEGIRHFTLAEPEKALGTADYFVLAVPYLQALQLTRTMNSMQDASGNTSGLSTPDEYAAGLGRSFRALVTMASVRSQPSESLGPLDVLKAPLNMPRPFDPPPLTGVWRFHRLFTGVQYFFDKNVRVGKGHVYYPGSHWGLSSVSQQQFWMKPIDPASRLYGSISVDIGDCTSWKTVTAPDSWSGVVPSQHLGAEVQVTVAGGVRWRSPTGGELGEAMLEPPLLGLPLDALLAGLELEVKDNVWAQVGQGLYRGTRERLMEPSEFHVDTYLREYWTRCYQVPAATLLALKVEDLLQPPGPWYMINSPSLRWTDRPGFYTDRPAVLTSDGAVRALPRASSDQTYASFDPDRSRVLWYEVANDQWVFAGAYNKTYTRLETMEAANESAKHAVNAILEHWMDARNGYATSKPMFGDFCEIWDPEKSELDDLEILRRLDEMLIRDGLPHFMDLLELDTRLEARATPGPGAAGRPVDLFLKLLDAASRRGSAASSGLVEQLSSQSSLGPLRDLLRAMGRDENP